MDFLDKQIAPPRSWEKFEDLCLALFRRLWADQLALKHGRRGQPQHGVDVYGCIDLSGATYQGVQCKGKDANYGANATVAELKDEIQKADRFNPPLQKWIFATTAPADVKLQGAARVISEERAKRGRFSVTVLGWEDIQSLLALHPEVLEQFYPEHGLDLATVARALKALTSNVSAVSDLTAIAANYSPASPAQTLAPPVWLPVKFAEQRDLKPALMGRPLGPADAMSCPRLSESQTLIRELRHGYFARLVGEAGAGKSICAFQTAHHFAIQGWRVMMLADPSVSQIDLHHDQNSKSLYLIDDAHLVAPWVLARAESQANEGTFLLTTHNSVEQSAARHGAIILDAKRAVRTIATELRKTLPETIRLVGEVDDRVRDGSYYESIEVRLDQAERADRPWQFCFILGGGWRRAKTLIDNARVAGADIILAIAGVRQIASRDARCNRDTLSVLIDRIPIPNIDLERAISWLISQRLLISEADLRTPHQRFATVALVEAMRGQTEAGQACIWEACKRLFQDTQLPLPGLRTLLHELSFGSGINWHSRVQRDWLDSMAARCWSANDADLPIAIMALSEILSKQSGWPKALSKEQRSKVVGWVSRPNNQIGYGLRHLLNDMRSDDEGYARDLMKDVDAISVATIYSEVSAKTTFYLGNYLSMAWQLASEQWKSQFLEALDRQQMLRVAETWPAEEPLSSFSEYCEATYFAEPSLALDMVDRIVPRIVVEIEKEPADTFHEVQDVAWHVLKGIDLLGIYAKKRRQTKREAAICRTISRRLPAQLLGERLSHTTKRQFQPAAWLLDFLRRSDPDVFTHVVRAIDWSKVDATVGDGWENPSHDEEVFLRIASLDGETAKTIAALIEERLKDAKTLRPKLALLSPNLIERHLDQGRVITIDRHGHVDWMSAAVILARLIEFRPDLVPAVLEPLVLPVLEKLSNSHPTFWRDAHLFFHMIRQFAAGFLERMLDGVDPATAESNWIAGIKSAPDVRRATAILVDAASSRGDAVGEMARRIRRKYPAKSKPIQEDVEEFTFEQ
ncbi:hypothetical protein [Bradyrhizobium erythrophlei]|uniref:Restriction endonuclease n=1 Tax=Bradyrhizobium erythrophlei TaxID=1437360 RepID=A0A1M5YSP3_9BRAD|nr:hypothetical protein [Bradyrhizobium erythrophlei]SHI14838.1 hypothetical protein SAMN05443248_8708 [Bradyrhizobium erythrophlei]